MFFAYVCILVFYCYCNCSIYVVIFSRLYFKGQMLVHLCLFVLLSLMSYIVCISLIIFEQINDDDDDDDDDVRRRTISTLSRPNCLITSYISDHRSQSSLFSTFLPLSLSISRPFFLPHPGKKLHLCSFQNKKNRVDCSQKCDSLHQNFFRSVVELTVKFSGLERISLWHAVDTEKNRGRN